tara:strand:- start:222 stop:500 length:279 start_codon:yes stop_codon:yes gene_type:complete
MPTYDYICEKCKQRFEHFQSMSSEPLKKHPECNGNVKRIVSGGTGLIFKGSGFYLTDYKKNGSNQKKENKDNQKVKKQTASSKKKKIKDKIK